MPRAPLPAGRSRCLLALCAGPILLGACADYFTNHPPPGGAVAWQGTSTATTGEPPESMPGTSCGPMRLELFVAGDRVGGRGWPAGAVERGWWRDLKESWWVEGDLYPNGIVLLTLRRQSALPEPMRPTSVWRGRYDDQRLVVAEQPLSCGREAELRPAR